MTTSAQRPIRLSIEDLETELRRLAAVYARAITTDAIAAWYGAVAWMPRALFAQAIDECIFERDRFPAPGTIIGYATEIARREGFLPPSPDDAWLALIGYAQVAARTPGISIHDFEDIPRILVDSATDAGATLARLNDMNEYQHSQARRDFTRIYTERLKRITLETIAAIPDHRLTMPPRITLPTQSATSSTPALAKTTKGSRR